MATAESVAVLAQEVNDMKAILNSKIGANDDIMISVTDKLGLKITKLDDFYLMLKENDNSIKQRLYAITRLLSTTITPPTSPTSR